jgi:PAS domain S-box-containing protein
MLGYSEDEVEHHLGAWARLVHPDDRDETLRAVEDFRHGRRSEFRVEFRLRHKTGRWVEILSRGALLRDRDGTPVRFIGTHVDITTAKRTAEQLERARVELERQVGSAQALEQAIAELSAAKERMRFQLAETPALLYSGSPDMPPHAASSAKYPVHPRVRAGGTYADPAFWLRQVHPEDASGVGASPR